MTPLTDAQVSGYAQRYREFLRASPTSYHAAKRVAQTLAAEGFTQVDPASQWPTAPGGHYLLVEGAILAWIQPHCPPRAFAVFGAHTDSPGLKLKPTPQLTTPDGWGQLLAEVYGGAIFNSWLDRELEVAGVVYDRVGRSHLVRTGPLARIPQLAIHLDRAVNQGLTLDPELHLRPVWTVNSPDAQIMSVICAAAGLDSDDVLSADLFCVPTEAPAMFGDQQQFLAAGRQDNLSSVYAGLEALLAVKDSEVDYVPLVAFFDHEEVGSSTRTGAAGPLLETVMRRTAQASGADIDRIIPASFCLSADAGHSVHPNYPDLHDSQTRPVAGNGPAAKINANQRYATVGSGLALWNAACEQASIPSQSFVSRNTVPCGSTIGPITSTRTGLATVDVGIPMLSMHSAREMIHVRDAANLAQVTKVYWENFADLLTQGQK